MRARDVCVLHALACGFFAVLWACGDDVTFGPDSGPPKSDATVDQTAPDAGDGGLDATSAPKLLMTYLGASGELATFDPKSGQVSGRLSTPGYPVVVRSGGDTFLVDTSKDLVEKLDPKTLASAVSTWNVAGNDALDGGSANADPVAVVESSASHAYVLRFNRNQIAVFDPSQTADAGAPTSFVDLSSLVQANSDGTVGMVGGVYDATRHRVYVVLGNIDINAYGPPPNYPLACVGTTTTMIAIDTTNDSLVSLGGSGPGGGVVLNGFNPQMGYYGGVALDTAGDRVFVVHFGCAPPSSDGGPTPIQQRLIEAVDLKTNTTTTLLDANGQDIPNVFALLDSTHAVVQWGSFPPYATYAWDTTSPTLGAPLAVAPDVFGVDPAGRILGPEVTTASDGGAGPTNVIAVTVADGGVTQLGQNPFLQSGGYNGNALYVP